MIRKSKEGFTIIELIITLVIVSILMGSGYMYMSGYLPKQRFNSSTSGLLNLLLITQSNAITKGARHGVIIKKDHDNPTFACSFRDAPGGTDYVCDGCNCADCTCGESAGQRWVQFKEGINLFDCRTDAPLTSLQLWDSTNAVAILDTIGFNINGFGYNKSGDLANFSVFLKSDELPEGTMVKEIEVNSGGLIELVKNGSGNITPGGANLNNCR